MDTSGYGDRMTTPEAASKRRIKVVLFIAGLVALAVIITAIAIRANRFEYDEAAHQRVIEAYGVNVADWDGYRDTMFEVCEFDEDTFELFVLMDEDLGRLQLDIQYTCPDRMDEFTDITGIPGFD